MTNRCLWVGMTVMLGACDAAFDLVTVTIPDAPPPDAAPDAPPPDGANELGFAAPSRLVVLGTTSAEGDPTLPTDMTEIYFKSNRPGGAGGDDLWFSTRASTTEPWSAPTLSPLSTSDHENACRIAPDGRTIWFRRSPAAGGNGMVLVSTRATRSDPWTTPVVLNELDTAVGDAQLVSTDPDQVIGYLSSRRVTTVSRLRIFRTTRTDKTQPWGTPMEVTELLDDNETYSQGPWATPDDLSIVFGSNRDPNGCDLWLARRASNQDPFGTPVCMTEIATLAFDADPWISPDLRHVYFTSNASGNYELWEAHR